MPLSKFSRHLYLRIWLAVFASIILVTFIAGLGMRLAVQNAEREATSRITEYPWVISVQNAKGEIVGTGTSKRSKHPSIWRELELELSNGETLRLQIPWRDERHEGPMRRRARQARPAIDPSVLGKPQAVISEGSRSGPNIPPPSWMGPEFFFPGMLVLIALAIGIGAYPVVRRLTSRLEALQRGVQSFGEGKLSTRVTIQGNDEVADLATRFNMAAARIEDLVRSQKSLLANASHELRSPLARIRMGMELIGERAPSNARKEILRNIGELDQLVEEILLTSRLDVKEANVGTPEQLDLLGLAAEECARVDAELQLDEHTSPPIIVSGIAKLLRRAIRNLLENARRYSCGKVTLHVAVRDGFTALSVCDEGPGVPEDQRERIFEPFYRMQGASERDGGVGLGLALVRTIAQRHNGSVYCTHRADGKKGACFVLRLPA